MEAVIMALATFHGLLLLHGTKEDRIKYDIITSQDSCYDVLISQQLFDDLWPRGYRIAYETQIHELGYTSWLY